MRYEVLNDQVIVDSNNFTCGILSGSGLTSNFIRILNDRFSGKPTNYNGYFTYDESKFRLNYINTYKNMVRNGRVHIQLVGYNRLIDEGKSEEEALDYINNLKEEFLKILN